MKVTAWTWLFLFLVPACLVAGKIDKAAFAEKAKELVAGKESRVEKLEMLHSFTRDQIKQVKTKYS